MKWEGGTIQNKTKLMLYTTLALAIVFAFYVCAAQSGLDASDDTTITYHMGSNALTVENDGTTSIPASTDAKISTYAGIKATEYNPEYWSGYGEVPDSYKNWRGPSGGKVTVSQQKSISISFKSGTASTTYYFKIPAGCTVSSARVGETNLTITNGVFSYTPTETTFTLDLTLTSAEIDVYKVFGGWAKSSADDAEIVYPGDVVEKSVTELWAKWITPDVFLITSDTINLNRITASSDSPYTLSIIEQHGYVSGENATGVEIYRGDGRSENSMFGTIFHFTKERIKDGGDSFDMTLYNFFVPGQNSKKQLPAGTYRSDDANDPVTIAFIGNPNTGSGGACALSGNVTIDNVGIIGSYNSSKHGDGGDSTLYANGYVLIMGTNISNPSLTTDADSARSLPQIFGGAHHRHIQEAVKDEDGNAIKKKIVYGDGVERTYEPYLGTFVIIHDGIYYNLVAGSFKKSIGTNNESGYLSTYMVLKGGSTTDTVIGGSSGGVTPIYGGPSTKIDSNNEVQKTYEDTGGTFVYVIGHYLPGDDWEDKETVDSATLEKHKRNSYSIIQSSVLEGGHSKGDEKNKIESIVYGSTHVFLSGTSSTWDVQGGGRSLYTHTDCSYIETSGKAVVRHLLCGTITDGATTNNNCVDDVVIRIGGDSVVASVYGGGFDTYSDPTGSSMDGSSGGSISIEMTGGDVGYIFGGGLRGTIGSEGHPIEIDVTVSGGTVHYDVYGGGSGGLDKVSHDAEGNGSFLTGGKGYLNSTGYSNVYGNINLTIAGDATIYGNVYGGGMSIPLLEKFGRVTYNATNIDVAQVYGDITVKVTEQSTVKGSVYGGGRGLDIERHLDDKNKAYYIIKDGEGEFEAKFLTTSNDPNGTGLFKKLIWYTNREYTYNTKSTFIGYENGALTGSYLNFAKVVGDVKVYVTNGIPDSDNNVGSIAGGVYGGGAIGKVEGSTYVEINNGLVTQNVFGGGYGVEGNTAVTEDRLVYITGPFTVIDGSVYGGSSVGNDGTAADFNSKDYSDSSIVVNQGTIKGSVFGGGFKGLTWGNTYVYVGFYYNGDSRGEPEDGVAISGMTASELENYDVEIRIDSIYAGGNTKEEDDTSAALFEKALVQGKGNIKVHGGNYRSIYITGSIMGSGNSCLTKLGADIELYRFNNLSEMYAIHRATNLTLYNSTVNISGRNTGGDKNASIYEIENFTLKFDSTVTIKDPIDQVKNFKSLNYYDNPTAYSTPSNKIVFTSGATFYVKYGSDYGSIEGYTVISALNDNSYGAYVIGPSASTGGFVEMKNGIYKVAESSTIDDEKGRCWFISGIEKKIVTINLNGAKVKQNATDSDLSPEEFPSSDSISNNNIEKLTGTTTYINRSLNTSTATVEIMKLQNDTELRYVGGTFTSLSSDYDGDYYSFMKPGLAAVASGLKFPENHNFGLIIGGGSANNNLIPKSSDEYYWLPSGDNNQSLTYQNILSTYFIENQSDSILFNNKSGSFDAGIYKLELQFVGAPSNVTAYVGYVTLNFQEVKEITLEDGSTVYLVANNIEVRADLYVIAEDSVTNNNSYTITMKTEEKSANNRSGYAEIIIPKGFNMGTLKLESVETVNINNNAKISVNPVINPDNTTGWMTTGSASWIVGSANNTENQSVGILIGSSPATVRYSIDNYQHQEGSSFILHFKTYLSGVADPVVSDITVNIEKKQVLTITFTDTRGDQTVNTTRTFTYGTVVTEDMCPSTGDNFVGWYVQDDEAPGVEYNNIFNHNIPLTNNNLHLQSRYMYKVTFDNMNGTNYVLYLPQSSGSVTKISEDMAPVLQDDAYETVKWYKDPDYSYQWDFDYETVKGDVTLYAKWIGKEVKVTFKYKSDSNWVTYSNNNNYTGFVSQVVGGVPDYLKIRVNSTFNLTVPSTEGKAVLKYVSDEVAKILNGGSTDLFIRWQVFEDNDPNNGNPTYVYADTTLSKSLVKFRNNNDEIIDPEIILFADIPQTAMQLVMNPGDDAVSAVVTAPQSYLVYPNGPFDIDSNANATVATANGWTINHDNVVLYEVEIVTADTEWNIKKNDEILYNIIKSGDDYIRTGSDSVVRFIPYEDTYICLDEKERLFSFEEVVGKDSNGINIIVTYKKDGYGNVWDGDNNFVRATMYTTKTVGNEDVEITLIFADNTYTEDGHEYILGTNETPYYKDRYGNHYIRTGGDTPSQGDAYTCTYGSEYYYLVSFILNDATRPGYKLLGWHNELVDDSNSQFPRSGTERTLRLFINHNDTNNATNEGAINRIVLEMGQKGNIKYVETKHYDDEIQKLNDSSNKLTITYVAQWNPMEYTVSVSNSTHGTIDAFLIKSNGTSAEREHIDGSTVATYGNRIVLNYTSNENYNFISWNIIGEYTIESSTSTSTTLVVLGHCSISVKEIGDRIVTLNMVFDGNECLKDDNGNYLADKDHISVYLYNETSKKYYKLNYASGGTPGDGSNAMVFRGNIPLADDYQVYVGYDVHDDDISGEAVEKYLMSGKVSVKVDNETNFTYYIISAYIDDSTVTYTGRNNETVTFSSSYNDVDFGFTRYVGALESEIFSKDSEQIINYHEEGRLPAVQITIPAGYRYILFEGFWDIDGIFKIDLGSSDNTGNYYTGNTQAGAVTREFDLNWTKFNKPAQIFIELDPLEDTITYRSIPAEGIPDISLVRPNVQYGDGLITKVTNQGLVFNADSMIDAHNSDPANVNNQIYIEGFYYDQAGQKPVRGVDVFNEDAVNSFSDSSNKVIWAKIVKTPIQRIKVTAMNESEENAGEDVAVFSSVIPCLKQSDSDVYVGTYNPIIIPNSGYSGLRVDIVKDSTVVSCEYSLEVVNGRTVVEIRAVFENNYTFNNNNPSLLVKVVSLKQTSTLQIASSYIDSITDNDWNTQRTFRIGKTVELPGVNADSNGQYITGWTVRSNDVNDSAVREIVFEDNRYHYTLIPADADKTLTFTPVYPEKTVKVTFLTTIGTFPNGEQRVEMTVPYESVFEQSSVPAIINPGTKIGNELVFQHTGYKNGSDDANFPVTLKKDTVFIADWTTKTLDFTCLYNDAKATVSATFDSSNAELGKADTTTAGYTKKISRTNAAANGLPYRSEVTLLIKPSIGMDLDIEGTKATFGEIQAGDPVKLSNDAGYQWTFFIDGSLDIKIQMKTTTYKINFIVNGTRLSDSDLSLVNLQSGGVALTSSDIGEYTTVTFGNYGGKEHMWYTVPNVGSATADDIFAHTGSGISSVYTYTVKGDLSLYAVTDDYNIYFYNYDGTSSIAPNLSVVEGKISLDISETHPDFYNALQRDDAKFIGWSVIDNGQKVYSYPSDGMIIVDEHTPSKISLYPFYLTTGDAEYLYNSQDQQPYYSSIENVQGRDQRAPNMTVYYSKTQLDSTNYNDLSIASQYASSASFTNKNILDSNNKDTNVVYYYVILYAEGSETKLFEYAGSFVVNVYENHVVNFKLYVTDEEFVNTITIKDNERIGTLNPISVEGYRFDGWFINGFFEGTEINENTLGTTLGDVTVAVAKLTKVTKLTFMDRDETVRTVTLYGNVEIGDDLPSISPSEGYTFDGWYIKNTDTQITGATNTSVLSDNVVIEAKWTRVLTVTFDGYVSGSGTMELTGDLTITSLPDAQHRAGYQFLGWYVTIGQNPVKLVVGNSLSEVIASSINAESKWAKKTIIDFSDRGVIIETRTLTDDEEIGEFPAISERTGYSYHGWYEGDTPTTLTPTTKGTQMAAQDEHFILSVKWNEQVLITFMDGANQIDAISIDVDTEQIGTLPAPPSRAGYEFKGWYKSDNTTKINETDTFDTSITVHSEWNKKNTVRFVYDNGTTDTNDVTIRNNEAIGAFPEPVYASHRFAGWYQGDVLTTYTSATTCNNLPITDDVIILTAHWVEQVTITFKDENREDVVRVIDIDTSIGNLPAPYDVLPTPEAITGYEFQGWFIKNTDELVSPSTVFGSTTDIESKWIKKNTVRFVYNNGTDQVDERVIRGTEAIGDFPKPTYTGRHCLGWYEGDELTTYTGATTCNDLPITDDAIVLTAKWEKKTIIHFVNYNNTIERTIYGDQTIGAFPEITVREGFTNEGYQHNYEITINEATKGTDLPYQDEPFILSVAWEQQILITFENDGAVYSTRYVNKGGAVGNLPVPDAKVGYEFKGWYKSDNTTKIESTSTFNANTTVHSEWTKKNTVRFVYNNGTDQVDEREIEDADTIGAFPEPVYTSHRFAGWYQGNVLTTYTSATTCNDLPITDNEIILTAHWVEQVTVTFMDGETSKGTRTIDIGTQQIGEFPDATPRAGYEFKGWYKSDNTTKINNTDTFDTSITVHSKWDKVNVVRFVFNNGTADTNEVTIRNDAAIGAFPVPTYASHRFAGWYQGDDQTTYTSATTCNDLDATDDAIVLTAHWVEQVTVTFKSGTSTIESRTFDKGSAVGELPAIGAQSGYTYTWKISNEETEINSGSTFDESKVVSLVWMKKNTVQFKDGIDSSVIVTREILGSQKIGDFPSTDKGEHYKFIGWYQGNALTSFTKDTSTSDMPTTDDTIVLTARWVESVTITFKDGTATVGTVTKWWDEALSNVPEASKEGHRFDGWYITKDEQQVRIENGMQMSVIPTTTIDAEARWIQQVTVTFMDGETSKGTRTIDVSEQIGVLPEVPSRAGYEYKGWYMEDGITKLQPSTLGTTLVGNSTTVYTATIHTEWIKITKIVLYNGDLLYRTIDIDEGGTVGDLPILADTEERTFNGWYKQDGTSLSPDTAATSLPETTDLYAKWTVKITFKDTGRDDVSVIITQGASIENLPVPDAKVGYEFKGWYKSDNTTKIESTSTFNANTTVHSEWTKKNTVRFVYNNGTDQVDEREIEDAETIGAFPVPTLADHRLTGWYQGDVLTTYTSATTCNDLPITDDEIILTAHWVEQVTVTFMNGTTEISKKTIDINTSITALPTIAASSGYSYKWMLSDNTTEVTSETKFNSDTTVSAKWTKTTIVVFHDGNTVLEERRLAENETVGAFPVPNNKDGYTFNGWYKQDGTTILPTTKATDLPHTTDLYAKWTQNESPSPYTPGHNPPSLERIETSSETIPNDDGSVTEKTSKTTTRVDGSKTEVVTESTVVDGTTITKVTETETDSRGNTTVSEQTTRTTENEDGSITKEIGIKDDEGNEKNIEITGDDETVTAVIPDMEPDSMKAVQKALSDMESKNVLIEIVTEEGQVTIPEESVPAIADNGYSVTVSNDDIGITLKNSVINNLDRIGGNVRLNFNEVEKDTLTEDQKDIIGDSYAITITLTVGDENVSLLGGQAEITVNPGYPIGKIYYVSSTGDVEDIEFEYDDATGEAKFIVEHFSVYVAVPADSGQDQSYYMYILIGALLVALALIAVAFMLRHR